MTVVVAYTTKDECWMASDSASSDGASIEEAVTPKVMRHAGGGLIGSAGSWLLLNLLYPLQKKKCEVSDVLDIIRIVKDGPHAEELDGAEVLMAWPGRPLVVVYSGGYYVELKSPYTAIGVPKYALGFLEGAKDEIDGTVLKKAVTISAKYSTSVGLPAKLLHVTKGSE
jgi:hypothetical protein